MSSLYDNLKKADGKLFWSVSGRGKYKMSNKAYKYMNKMRSAAKLQLNNPRSPYFGREGHLRLAREIGVALMDFNEEERKEIFSSSYGMVYVSGCNLKPILDAKEWIETMRLSFGKEFYRPKLKADLIVVDEWFGKEEQSGRKNN